MPVKKSKTRIKSRRRPAKRKPSRSSWLDAFGSIPPFAHFLFIFVLLVTLFLLFVLSGNGPANELYQEAKKQAKITKKYELKYNVFGDHYVNNISIDSGRTNFFHDITTTAYIFNPQYNWLDKGSCQDRYCGLTASDYYFAGALDSEEVEYCLDGECLKVTGKELFYNDNKLTLPEIINSGEIKNITIYPLSTTWLVGFVYQDGNFEKGRAYQFNGSSFVDLDANNEIPFVSRENFNRATFGFGGEDDNFIVLYGGYDFLGYQVTNGEKVDISRFFGLRVSDGGFTPIAFKEEVSGDTLWYVCSLSEKKPRLIKLWQNGSDSIKGSFALSEILLEDRERADSAYCIKGDNPGEIELVVTRGRSYIKKLFQDNGFEQKTNYILSSRNLLSKNGLIDKAKFEGLLACDDTSCDDEVLENSFSFKTSGNGSNYTSSELHKTILFSGNSEGLYYQLETAGKIGNNHYSPWVDGLTDISYSWWE